MKLKITAQKKLKIKIKQYGDFHGRSVEFIAFLEGQEVGEILLTRPYDEDPADHDYIPGSEEDQYYGVSYIYVVPELRGRGIAQQLMEHAQAIASQYQSESLEPNTLITEEGSKFFR